MRRGQRGVAAEIDLGGRGEPADMVAGGLFDEKSGFGEVVFRGDLLHGFIVQP